MIKTVEADYLVVGAGAMGMAFADSIISETDASVIMVDRHHRPGGHWNDAYPFVRLHQPSSFYGVNSKELSTGTIDQQGWNEGLYELASSAEGCSYFDQVMQQQFLPSGRVQFLPMSEYHKGKVTSSISGLSHVVSAGKTVDATYMNVSVPSIREPLFVVEPDVNFVPINTLANVSNSYGRYVIIGGGKTSMDACLFLLGNGVLANQITWIRPRDSWILNRKFIQPGSLAAESARGQGMQLAALMAAESLPALFAAIEPSGLLMRLDTEVNPTMYRCATCTEKELEALRTIKDVVRLGHVTRITCETIELEHGSVPTATDALHVDCSADGLARRPVKPVFDGEQITLQAISTCQQVFSAAMIGHVEAAYETDAEKNELCQVVPHPDTEVDYLRTMRTTNANRANWAQDPEMQRWLEHARLDGFTTPPAEEAPPLDPAVVEGMVTALAAGQSKLDELIERAEQTD